MSLLAAVLGCSGGGPAEFRLNTEGCEPGSISRLQAEDIRETMAELFGTPDEPRAPDGSGLRLPLLRVAAGPAEADQQGRESGLYRKHCASCHGISGDGAGPVAAILDPYPRDFRNGVYKWTSTTAGAKAVWDDLDRALTRGMPGTAMPAFNTLPREQLDALIEYTRYLSLRGETELVVRKMVLDDFAVDPLSVAEDTVEPAARLWQQAEGSVVEPPRPPDTSTSEALAASIARGRALFVSKQSQCVSCHGPEGYGDGEQAAELYDDWNKLKKGNTPEQTAVLAHRFRLPIQKLRPRNFHEGVFRGGDRPIDLYWRIYCGIKGTPMPPHGPTAGNPGVLAPAEIRDVVSYVQSLSAGPR